MFSRSWEVYLNQQGELFFIHAYEPWQIALWVIVLVAFVAFVWWRNS